MTRKISATPLLNYVDFHFQIRVYVRGVGGQVLLIDIQYFIGYFYKTSECPRNPYGWVPKIIRCLTSTHIQNTLSPGDMNLGSKIFFFQLWILYLILSYILYNWIAFAAFVFSLQVRSRVVDLCVRRGDLSYFCLGGKSIKERFKQEIGNILFRLLLIKKTD